MSATIELTAAPSPDDNSPIEQAQLIVPTDDDSSLPVYTFRMWFLGIIFCALLSFVNIYFSYRTEPLSITMISVQEAALPIGQLMARVLSERKFRVGSWEFSLNPGPFNMKEHVLISMFANAGSGSYPINIITIIKAFYLRKISLLASFILVITTQVNRKEIYKRYKNSTKSKMDIHTRLMKKYKDVLGWWFQVLLVVSLAMSLVLCIFMKDQVQLPWWSLLFAAAMALIFTLSISIITATTNQTPGLNIITVYVMGLVLPGKSIVTIPYWLDGQPSSGI